MNHHEKFFSKIGRNYLILGIITIIFQIIALNLLNITFPEYLNDTNIITSISAVCNYILPLPIFYWLMKKIKTSELEKTRIDLKTFILYISISMTLMWMGNMIGLTITALLSGAMQSTIANPVQQLINSTDIWLNIILISFIGPIFEELFFRKLIIDRTIKYGAKVSIVLSALIFAFFHGNVNQFFYALFLGGFFSYVYIKTGKITYTMILHIIVNFMGSVVSIFVADAAMNLQTGSDILDVMILLIYLGLLFIFLLLGIYKLTQIKKARFNGKKTEIGLKKPYRTMFLNIGMVLFIAYYVFEMIRQIIG